MRHILFSLTFFLSFFPLLAQPIGTLGVGPSGIQAFADSLLQTPLDSAELGSKVYYRVPLFNAGNTTISDTFTVDFVSITSLDSFEQTIGSFLFNTPPLAAGDSFPTTPVLVDSVTAARYGTGGGGVVVIIWPAARNTSIATGDSGSIAVNLLSAGIAKGPLPVHLKFGPNPTQQLLHFSYGSDKNKIERVIIRDLNGHIVSQASGAVSQLSLASFSPGTYLLSVHTFDGRNTVVRIIKYEE